MKRTILSISSGIAIVLAAVLIVLAVHKPDPAHPLLPAALTKQISFVVYMPANTWRMDSTHAAYSSSVLSYKAVSNNITLSITEQATPDVFTDVPEYYPNLINRLHSYDTIGTANGTAYLTRPSEFRGGQQAVLNTNGTLMFVHPTEDLSNDAWRRFFNTLQITKPA